MTRLERSISMQLPDINLDSITDPALRLLITHLLNHIEQVASENQALRTQNQQLRDELARLKGGSGKPDIKPSTGPARSSDHSSEQERRSPKPRHKGRKLDILTPTRTEPCVLDPASLPPGAIRSGTSEVIVQDLIVRPEIIRFVREVWYDPASNTTFTAPLPPGYCGQFGPHIYALTLTLGHQANLSQPSLLTFFQTAGIHIGAGTIARWLSDDRQDWLLDAQLIDQAGLESGEWQASDQTSTRVAGKNHTCHVLGNRFFTLYQTRAGGTRQDVLAVLWGREPLFRLNQEALAWMEATQISVSLLRRLITALPWDSELTSAHLREHLAQAGITLGKQQRQQVWDALAIAAYHAQTEVPIIRQLLSDDAAVYHSIVEAHGLCWIHDGRHYAKLTPVVRLHQGVLASFRKAYWKYYRELLAYRAAPSVAERERLRAEFTKLFTQRTGYGALDERIGKSWENREKLLMVLEHPDIPLHNNDMELAARKRVRKRDVSFGPQSEKGARAWDTFQTIIATAAKLGVRVYDYFLSRLQEPATAPRLADYIRERAHLAAFAPVPA